MKTMRIRLMTAAMAVMIFFGCAGKRDPARFYQILSSRKLVSQEIFDAATPVPVLSVGPVLLPAYLDRPQIVSRSDNSRLSLAEFDKWAEPLEDNISRIILSELTRQFKDRKIALVPWRQKTFSAGQLSIAVLQMDNSEQGDAVLVTRWTLTGPGGNMLVSRIYSLNAPVENTGDVNAWVKSQGINIETLCQEMAEAIEQRIL
jgi:uncharacterized lipoprotein YmbA